jgi:hypothetical protein
MIGTSLNVNVKVGDDAVEYDNINSILIYR